MKIIADALTRRSISSQVQGFHAEFPCPYCGVPMRVNGEIAITNAREPKFKRVTRAVSRRVTWGADKHECVDPTTAPSRFPAPEPNLAKLQESLPCGHL